MDISCFWPIFRRYDNLISILLATITVATFLHYREFNVYKHTFPIQIDKRINTFVTQYEECSTYQYIHADYQHVCRSLFDTSGHLFCTISQLLHTIWLQIRPPMHLYAVPTSFRVVLLHKTVETRISYCLRIWKTLLYQIEWRIIWKRSYFLGRACQRKCCWTFLTASCISKYFSSGIDVKISFKFEMSFSAIIIENASQFKISKKGGTKLSEIITGTHS